MRSHRKEIDPEIIALDIFKPDPNFPVNQRRYEEVEKTVLGDESESEDEDEYESEDEQGSDAASDYEEEVEDENKEKEKEKLERDNIRMTFFMIIIASTDNLQACHELLNIKLKPGQEMDMCIVLLECLRQERTYRKNYGLLAEWLCMINKVYQENFGECFVQQYSMIQGLEMNELRNLAKFFAHLLGTDSMPWHVLAYIRLTEEDITSSSRIFVKILFQVLSNLVGAHWLNERLTDPTMQETYDSIFPKDNPKNIRFSINFFTVIGLGGITESLRKYATTYYAVSASESDGNAESAGSNERGRKRSKRD